MKPREFWIIDNKSAYEEPQDMGYVRGEQIHAIEYSAYEQTKKLCDQAGKDLLDALADNKRLRDVLVALRNSTNHSAIVMLISEALGE